MLVLLASLFLNVAAAPAPAPPELMDDPDVLAYCRTLLQKSAADDFNEYGAFIVRTPEGRLYFVAWPPSGRTDRLRWRGAVPQGAIAIVHTHPPMTGIASKIDAGTARRTGLPVYILTPRRIVRTVGDGTEVIRTGKW